MPRIQSFFSKLVMVALFFVSGALCASAHNNKNYSALIDQYNFVYHKDGLNYGIKIFLKKMPRDAIGFIEFNKDSDVVMRVEFIDIYESHQCKGLGSVLLQAAIKKADDFGCKHIKLLAYPEVGSGASFNANLKRLVIWYERFGFKSIANEGDFCLGGQSMMVKAPFKLDVIKLPEFSFDDE